jgi:hypothetical protein
MAVNKPVGDNARKGAVKTHPVENDARRRQCLDQTEQDFRRVHDREKTRRQKEGR